MATALMWSAAVKNKSSTYDTGAAPGNKASIRDSREDGGFGTHNVVAVGGPQMFLHICPSDISPKHSPSSSAAAGLEISPRRRGGISSALAATLTISHQPIV